MVDIPRIIFEHDKELRNKGILGQPPRHYSFLSSLTYPLKKLAKILICRLLILSAFSILIGASDAPCREIHDPQVAVLVSQDIRPYIEAVEGLNVLLEKAAKARLEVFHLEKFKGKERTDLAQRLANNKFDLFVAIGPDAARFVSSEISSEKTPRIFSMVLNPESAWPCQRCRWNLAEYTGTGPA